MHKLVNFLSGITCLRQRDLAATHVFEKRGTILCNLEVGFVYLENETVYLDTYTFNLEVETVYLAPIYIRKR